MFENPTNLQATNSNISIEDLIALLGFFLSAGECTWRKCIQHNFGFLRNAKVTSSNQHHSRVDHFTTMTRTVYMTSEYLWITSNCAPNRNSKSFSCTSWQTTHFNVEIRLAGFWVNFVYTVPSNKSQLELLKQLFFEVETKRLRQKHLNGLL